MNSSYYKYCIVPQCKSTTTKTPNKLFIYVPNNEQIRKNTCNFVNLTSKATLGEIISHRIVSRPEFDIERQHLQDFQFRKMDCPDPDGRRREALKTSDFYRTCQLPKRFEYPSWFYGYGMHRRPQEHPFIGPLITITEDSHPRFTVSQHHSSPIIRNSAKR
ncbi:hypothetical protein NQ317_001988 [Molorchus minor]|uniref:Uncharacterized protein n=1 Tax=Molorchus minor TaxID=1323400 RepID=A0ABQ9JI70_9CUCU|nr:hypothetical protein NQ317_001988 [Molorchus minor]